MKGIFQELSFEVFFFANSIEDPLRAFNGLYLFFTLQSLIRLQLYVCKKFYSSRQKEVMKSACNCAVFAVPGTEPIIQHMLPCNVSCDREGLEKCQKLCIALVETVRDNVPMLICEKVNMHIENLKVALYIKSCDSFWVFTGLKSAEPICCHEGKAFSCNEAMPTIEN
ncbi:follicle cell protein 3C-1-like [Camponotus floridanus]|uniref:follicle cell protein 3C-1-like n=1 Tax=Camponotus floridanus TaxID=104421 RepID=UPI000DC68DFB|nr:follicle cell protein 3C-1-like [Camponotus floridanus]